MFFYFVNVSSLFRNYLTWEKGVVLYLKKREFLSFKNLFVISWAQNSPSGSGEEVENVKISQTD